MDLRIVLDLPVTLTVLRGGLLLAKIQFKIVLKFYLGMGNGELGIGNWEWEGISVWSETPTQHTNNPKITTAKGLSKTAGNWDDIVGISLH